VKRRQGPKTGAPEGNILGIARKTGSHFFARCYAEAVTSYRLCLILAGAFAVAVIAFATVLADHAIVPGPALLAMLLGTYAGGLGLGRLALGRGG
jgi:hypothetical protein